MKINPILYHIALISFCLAIFILSSIPGEEFPKVDFEFSDKIVHFIIYGILFILFFYSLNNQTKNIKLQKHALEFALLFTVLYGATDEIHQKFVTNRSCELSDWIADSAGALMAYSIFKIYFSKNSLKKAALLTIIPFIISGCSASNEMNNVNVSIAGAEVWLDLMPVVGELHDPLGFLISINIEAGNASDKYEIKDLKIYLNNDTVSGKRFQTEILPASNNVIKINLSQVNEETYLNKSIEQPTEAQFIFNLNKNNKKVKTLKTSKLTINKVY